MNTLPNNNIPDLILKSIFKSTNIELANVQHHTNITYLHNQMNKCKTNQTNKLDIKQIVETFGLVYFDGIIRHKTTQRYEICNQ